MAGGKLYAGSNMSLLLQNERLPCSSQLLESLWPHTSNPSSFQGTKCVVDFENVSGSRVLDRPFFEALEKEENCDEDYEGCFHQSGKKRRLTSEQVQFLEGNFEVENKLEPERKVQLAKELGLQPRQVAIWFQNRRARFKTKQLEKDYGALKVSYDRLKGDYESLLQENDKLKAEVNSLESKLILRDKEKDENLDDDKSSDPDDAVNSPHYHHKEPMDYSILNATTSEKYGTKVSRPIMVTCKQEDANSAKSDVLDSESPHCTDGNHPSSFMEPADSSHAFEPDHSVSDEEDNLSEHLLTLPSCLPKVEEHCYAHPPENSCNFGFQVEDQTFCFWPY